MTLTRTYRHIIAAIALMALPAVVHAQYYDDDIYYNAEKAAKKKAQEAVKKTEAARGVHYVPNSQYSDLPGSDNYVINSGSTRDVDEYNRRGQFLVGDAVTDSTEYDDDTFAATRRIERFHNPDVVTSLGDDDLASYYYSQQPANTYNIYVVNDNPWYPGYSSWAWRYGSPWYVWNWGIYDPWYSWNWGWYPSSWNWSWNWGWGWNWSWSWGPSWAWGPSWGHGPGWGPSWGWAPPRPATPGAGRPHNPVIAGNNRPGNYGGGSHAGSAAGYRPTTTNNSGALRPGQASRPGASTSASAGSRPGSNVSTPGGTYRPATPVNGNSQGSANRVVPGTGFGTRGGNSSGTVSSPSRGSSSSSNAPSRGSSNSGSSYRGSSSSSHSSGSSSGYGGRGGGGGSHSGGGGSRGGGSRR